MSSQRRAGFMNGFTVPACVAPRSVGKFSGAPGMQCQRTVVQRNTFNKILSSSLFISQDADDASIESIDDIPEDYMDGLVDVHVSLNVLF
jgi:hypothetical protein